MSPSTPQNSTWVTASVKPECNSVTVSSPALTAPPSSAAGSTSRLRKAISTAVEAGSVEMPVCSSAASATPNPPTAATCATRCHT